MIKRKDIVASNIDNYIRQERKRLVKMGGIKMLNGLGFYWNEQEWDTLEFFTGTYRYFFKEGTTFMGSKHYKQKI